MTTKEQLHRLVDELDEAEAKEALEYVQWLLSEEEELTEEEMDEVREGLAEIDRGESISLDDLLRKLGE